MLISLKIGDVNPMNHPQAFREFHIMRVHKKKTEWPTPAIWRNKLMAISIKRCLFA